MSELSKISFRIKEGLVVETLSLPNDYLNKTGQEALRWPNGQEKDPTYVWNISEMSAQPDGSIIFVFVRNKRLNLRILLDL